MQPGQLISGEYLLQKLLSDGSTGEVWRALEVKYGRLMRLRFIPESVTVNNDTLQRLRRHFDAVLKFKHPHVVPQERFVERSDAGAFFVSRFIDGHLLDEYAARWVQAEGKFPFNLIFDVLRPVATALDEAKRQNLLHRTLTPREIVISPAEGVLIYDFDLPGLIQESLFSGTADDLETIRYLAPEQLILHKAEALSDQYAFAMIIAELLANKILYPVKSTEEFRTLILTVNPPMLPKYPDYVNAALQRGLHRDPTVRFPSCIHLLDGLAGLIPVAFPTVYTAPIQTEKCQAEKIPSSNILLPQTQTKESTIIVPTELLDDIYAVSASPVLKSVAESTAAESSISIPTQALSEPTAVESIVPFQKIASAAQSATAEKIAKKIQSEHRFQRLFWLWNMLLLIGIPVAVYTFWDHISIVWKQRVQGAVPVEIVERQENLQNEKKTDKVKLQQPVARQQRTRRAKEENFNEITENGGDSDEVRFLGTSGSGKKIIFVVDISAAMGHGEYSSWEHVRKELVFSFKDLNPSQHFQVVYFNETPAVLPNDGNADPSDLWIPVSPQSLKNSYSFLKTVNSSGLCNPLKALEKALSMKPDVVFFISDQQSNALTLREIDSLHQTAGSIPINAVEIGEGTEPKRKSPIQSLAQTCHGEYKWIDSNIHGITH